MLPPWVSTSRSSARPVVDLPHPDSPTRLRVSPGHKSKLTFSTACTSRVTRLRIPLRSGKRATRSRTLRIGSPATTVFCPSDDGLWFNSGKRRGSEVPRIAPSRGTAASSAWVYGCFGARKISSTLPVSTASPRYITSTRSAISATTPISWVIKITPIAISFCRTAISCKICAWIVTSSAVVGSSAISTAGRQESAMAIITR